MTKIVLGFFAALSLMSAAAFADCLTFSNGLDFSGVTAQDAVYGCQVSPGTNAYECQENVRCDVVPAPYPYPYPVVPVYPRPYPAPGFGPHPFPGPGFGPRPGFGPHPFPGPHHRDEE